MQVTEQRTEWRKESTFIRKYLGQEETVEMVVKMTYSIYKYEKYLWADRVDCLLLLYNSD